MPAKWAFAIGAGRRRARDYKVKWRTERAEKRERGKIGSILRELKQRVAGTYFPAKSLKCVPPASATSPVSLAILSTSLTRRTGETTEIQKNREIRK